MVAVMSVVVTRPGTRAATRSAPSLKIAMMQEMGVGTVADRVAIASAIRQDIAGSEIETTRRTAGCNAALVGAISSRCVTESLIAPTI